MTAPAPRRVPERDLQRTVTDMLDLGGWAHIHHQPARRADGRWRTPGSGNAGKGWPDLFAVRGDTALALELKAHGGRSTPEQQQWIEWLRPIRHIEAHVVWLPRDFDFVESLIVTPPQQMTLTGTTGATWTPIKSP